jgi:hypothetical protein
VGQFEFTVNHSLCNYPYHPITVPILQHHDLVSQGLDQDDLTLVGPDGQKFTGRIRRGIAGWGKFFQIVIRNGHPHDELVLLPMGQSLLVGISRGNGGVRVQLSRLWRLRLGLHLMAEVWPPGLCVTLQRWLHQLSPLRCLGRRPSHGCPRSAYVIVSYYLYSNLEAHDGAEGEAEDHGDS